MMKKSIIYFIRIYQKTISPLKKQPTCRFRPTCSQYFIDALEIHGTLKGTILGLRRISQCQPYSKHFGYDPVPPKGLWNNKK